jgi:pimeloyl-ACP methyl ester carboxylesterase
VVRLQAVPFMIKRRHVFHIGGYDPIVPERQLDRFRKSLLRFEGLWNVSAQASNITHVSPTRSVWESRASGPNWATDVTFEILRWDDLVARDVERSTASRILNALRTLFDFMATGTLFRYLRASPKYTGFFMFPYVAPAALAAPGVMIAFALCRLLRFTGLPAVLLGAVVCNLTFSSLIKWLDPRRRIGHALDDAIFSRQFLYGQRIEMENRLDEFADIILQRVRESDADEIVIVGHSLGAAMAVASIAASLAQDPKLGAYRSRLCLLTVGATIPKFALHPRGGIFRSATKAIADQTLIKWSEYQARDDVISFYRINPTTLRKVRRDELNGRPNIRRVQLPSMMSAASFRRHRFNFMRLHYQFLMGNDQIAPYDYCMIVCGPLAFEEITAPTGAVGRFQADGAVLDKH